jgi:MFS family permease
MFKKVFPLSAVIGLRFLSLFLVLPVISVYAIEIQGDDFNPLYVGLVVGGYALTQALFQIPFGMLSDKIGRKITITIGLLIAIAGSIIAAEATTIEMLMVGRFLQGAGAVGAVITAMIGDLVAEEVRGKAMAIMGGTIGMAFALSMILGPILGGLENGTPLLFWITAGLSIFSIFLLYTKVPTPPRIKHTYRSKTSLFAIAKDPQLFGLFVANFLQKGMMIAAFVMIPRILKSEFGWSVDELWYVYLPAIIVGLIMMGPAAVFGEKYNKPKLIFLISIGFFIAAFGSMGYADGQGLFIAGAVFFFIAFNLMEPLLQSMITKFAKVHQKGTALGMGNTFGYTGSFLGGITAGYLLLDRTQLGMVVTIIAAIWFLWTLFIMKNPTKMAYLYLPLEELDHDKAEACDHEGLVEWHVNETEHKAVFKFKADSISVEDFKLLVIKA